MYTQTIESDLMCRCKYIILVPTVFFTIMIFRPDIATAQLTATGNSGNQFIPGFGLTGNYSHNSFRAWGKMQNTRQSQLLLNFRHLRIKPGETAITVSSELILTSWIRYPVDGVDGPRENAMGLGLIPMRFQIPFSKDEKGFYFTASAGFLVFGNKFPSNMGARFNYTLDAGIGYQFRLRNGNLLQAGYKLNHLSNGNSGEQNPGIDSQNIFFGILFDL